MRCVYDLSDSICIYLYACIGFSDWNGLELNCNALRSSYERKRENLWHENVIIQRLYPSNGIQ